LIPVRLSHPSCPITINIIFKVDTGAPISTLTTEALEKLYNNCPTIERTFLDAYPVLISGHKILVQRSQAHYQTLNILGANFMAETNSRLEIDYLKFERG
jgi:hypothetical protein